MVGRGCDCEAAGLGNGGDVDVEPLAGEVGERLLNGRGVSRSETLMAL